ncbi:MAG: periplasmic protein TonB [Bryobacterales bacterium]|nr:periplasmic protein TonB [Bryobacterales bacterium]
MFLARCLLIALPFATSILAWQEPRARAVISSQPLPSPEQISLLEQEIARTPDNIQARVRALEAYAAAAPLARDDYRAARLRHIQFLIQANPARDLVSTSIAWVGSNGTPYANADDHASVRSLWLAQVSDHFDDTSVILNALRFLAVEDKQQAEDLFIRAMAERPSEVEIASHLGFFYAAGLAGADTLDGRVRASLSDKERASWSDHCRAQLEETLNTSVLMGASTALPNIAMRRTGGGPNFEGLVKYSEQLRSRAATLDASLRKGMPQEFQMFADEAKRASEQPGPQTLGVPFTPNQIRVAPNAQSPKVLLAPPPNYPAAAMQGNIQGTVRLQVVIGQDGAVTDVRPISGHPMLVQPAVDAVKTWTYRPTLLNGSPVSVVTTVDVPFTLPPL